MTSNSSCIAAIAALKSDNVVTRVLDVLRLDMCAMAGASRSAEILLAAAAAGSTPIDALLVMDCLTEAFLTSWHCSLEALSCAFKLSRSAVSAARGAAAVTSPEFPHVDLSRVDDRLLVACSLQQYHVFCSAQCVECNTLQASHTHDRTRHCMAQCCCCMRHVFHVQMPWR